MDQEGIWMISKMWLPVMMFLGGVACIASAVATGQAEVDLVVVIPVFSGSSALFLLGTGLIVLSFLAGFAMVTMTHSGEVAEISGGSRPAGPAVEKKTQYGGVVLIGPLPIAFGSDRKTATVMLILGIAMAIALVSIILMLGQ